MSFHIHKRNVDLIFSVVASLIKILLRNIDMFESLNRMLDRWLEGKIADGERIRRIQWLESTFNQNG